MDHRCNSPLTTLFSLLLLLLLLLLLVTPPFSSATLHRPNLSPSSEPPPPPPGLLRPTSTPQPPSTAPTTYFQVTRPIPLPHTKPCSLLLFRHDFASTYRKPPLTFPYNPPSHCHPRRSPLAKAVLEWKASCRGRQLDRMFGVWLGGVELIRGCTAEPRATTGTVWTVHKDVTRYASLFSRNHTLSVYLANAVDRTYTGVYHVNLTLHLYYGGSTAANPHLSRFGAPPADLVLPISRDLPLRGGHWFAVVNSTDVQSKELAIPRNAYRAVLEVYVSFHSSDESWYSNPNEGYISANNLTGTPGNGPFRELTVAIDGDLVGAVWPFPVIYPGGVNPLLWRPITGIASFDLPSYDLEITPFLGRLLDGKPHQFGFAVAFALHVWFVDANLHVWLDGSSLRTLARLVEYDAPDLKFGTDSEFDGLDGFLVHRYARRVSSAGWVASSHGNVTTRAYQVLDYKNSMDMSGNGSTKVTQQLIDSTSGVSVRRNTGSVLYSEQVVRHFPLYLHTRTAGSSDEGYSLMANLSFGFYEERAAGDGSSSWVSSLANSQQGEGDMVVKGGLVVSNVGSTQQVYRYESRFDGCYFRNVSSRNYNIVFDVSGKACSEG